MSVFDRAVKALNDVDEAIDHLADNEAYVTALQAAGLLAPDTPELAQPLAEETYEYIVQVHREGRWQFYIGESRLPTDKPGLANGFSQKNHAQEFAKLEVEYPTRIVRRRVSPPEVINE